MIEAALVIPQPVAGAGTRQVLELLPGQGHTRHPFAQCRRQPCRQAWNQAQKVH
jgi:hypothetical protein